MNAFVNASRQVPDSRTENGAATFSSSLNACVDLFFKMGASRGQASRVVDMFKNALNEDSKLAIRLALWGRDVRGGCGERDIFRNMIINLEEPEQIALIPKVVEVGRWDDLLVMFESGTNELQEAIAEFWKNAVVNEKNGLAAKWAPRKGLTAVLLRGYWEMTPKQYRKTLVNTTNVVETKMCAREWDSINFAHVPSVAAARYNKAFYKNASESYQAYKEALVKGETKINASAMFPHDVIRTIRSGQSVDHDVVNEQWKALPDYLGDAAGDILVLSDVSGSMDVPVSGIIRAMDISIALGLYISERQKGPYKDLVMTFDSTPQFHHVRGRTLTERAYGLERSKWGGSTNLQAAFDLILDLARKNKVPQEDMPKSLLILSDMEFDQACARYDHYSSVNVGVTNFQALQNKYQKAGYELPKVIFWNLNSRTQNVPVRYNQDGVALVSGFSPAIMKSILACKEFTPEKIMLDTIMNPRYDVPNITI